MLAPIPKEEQLQALASGLATFYGLVRRYLGRQVNAAEYRENLTINKQELTAYLANHIELAKQHISAPTDPKYHESPVLEKTATGFRVYTVDHGRAVDIHEFSDLAAAAATYLLANW